MAATAAVVNDLRVLFEMREMLKAGFLAPAEYNKRRLEIIDEMTGTVRPTSPSNAQRIAHAQHTLAER